MTSREIALQLREAFGFTEFDLLANRRGELSPRQQSFMDKVHPAQRELEWWLLGIIMAALLIGLNTGLFTGAWLQLEVLVRLPIILAGLILAGYQLWKNYPLKTRRVHMVEGTAELKPGFKRHKNLYTLTVNNKPFRIFHLKEYELLRPGARYRVYFIDTAPPIILSLQEL